MQSGQKPEILRPLSLGLRLSRDLSPVDRGIIRALQADGRRPYSHIAQDLKITERTVRRRARAILESRVVEITTVSIPEVLGYGASAMLGIRVVRPARASEVAARLFESPAVDYAAITAGRYDMLVEVLCADREDLLRTVEEDIACVAHVGDCEIFPYLRLQYLQPAWDAAQRKDGVEPTLGPVELDELDRRIMHVLHADGRLPFGAVAEQLDVSESHIRKRYNRMVAAGALRVVAITNPRSLAFDTTAWLAIRTAPGCELGGLATDLARLPSIAYLAICGGRFPILAEAVCRHNADLLRLLDQEVRTLPGIESVEPLVCLDLLYRSAQPRA